MNILFIINDGFEEIETTAPYDILKRAGLNPTIASNKTKAIGAHGLELSNLSKIDDINYKDFDMLILPGGPQWKNNINDNKYIEIMSYFAENKVVAAVCASPTLLGANGYLKGKTYTCFPPMNADFGGNFTGSAAETSGNIITGRGAGSSLEFGFEIVKYIFGPEKVSSLKQSMFF